MDRERKGETITTGGGGYNTSTSVGPSLDPFINQISIARRGFSVLQQEVSDASLSMSQAMNPEWLRQFNTEISNLIKISPKINLTPTVKELDALNNAAEDSYKKISPILVLMDEALVKNPKLVSSVVDVLSRQLQTLTAHTQDQDVSAKTQIEHYQQLANVIRDLITVNPELNKALQSAPELMGLMKSYPKISIDVQEALKNDAAAAKAWGKEVDKLRDSMSGADADADLKKLTQAYHGLSKEFQTSPRVMDSVIESYDKLRPKLNTLSTEFETLRNTYAKPIKLTIFEETQVLQAIDKYRDFSKSTGFGSMPSSKDIAASLNLNQYAVDNFIKGQESITQAVSDNTEEQAKIQAKAVKDHEEAVEKSNERILELNAEAATLAIKADGDVYAAKISKVDEWVLDQKKKLDIVKLGDKQFAIENEAINRVRVAKLIVIEAERAAAYVDVMNRLTDINEKYVTDTEALWETYSGIVLKTSLDTGAGQYKIIQAQYIKQEAALKQHTLNVTDFIKEQALRGAISWEDAGVEITRTQNNALKLSEALLSVKQAKQFDAIIDTIVAGLDRLSTKFGDVARISLDAWKVISNTKKVYVPDPNDPTNIAAGKYEDAVDPGQKLAAGLSAASALANIFITSESRSAVATKSALALAATGAAIGAAFTPLGAGIGAAAGALIGLVQGWNAAGVAARTANKEADHAIDVLQGKLIDTYGSLSNIDMIGKMIGVDLKGAWGDTTVAGLEHFKNLVDEFEAKMTKLKDTLTQYGLTWRDVGEDMRQYFQGKIGGDLVEQFNLMVGSGVSVEKVIKAMSEELSNFIITSIQAGTKIPAEMEPIIKKMIEMGEITNDASRAMLSYFPPGTLDVLQSNLQAVKDKMADLFKVSAAGWADTGDAAKTAQATLIDLTLRGYDAAAGGTKEWLLYQDAVKQFADATLGVGNSVSKLVDESVRAQHALFILKSEGYDTATEGSQEWFAYRKAIEDWEKAAQAAGAAMVGMGNNTVLAMFKAKAEVTKAIDAIAALEKKGYDAAKEGTKEWKEYQAAVTRWKDAVKIADVVTSNLTENQKRQLNELIAKYGDINGEIEEYLRLVGLANANPMPSLADITAAAERYGLTLDQLGSKVRQLSINEQANQVIKDFELLVSAGADAGTLLTFIPESSRVAQAALEALRLKGYDTAAEGSDNWKEYQKALDDVANSTKGMGEQVQELVIQALKYGLELPEAMRPLAQAMIDAGLLTDETGEKMSDLSRLTFAKDLGTMFEELMIKLGQLIDTIGGVGSAVAKIPRNIEVDVHGRYYPPDIPENPDRLNAAGGGLVTAGTILRRAGGGPVFTPQGSDIVPAMLTPGERVLSVSETRNYDKLLPTGLGSEAIKNLLNQSTDGLNVIGSFVDTVKNEITNALKIPPTPAPWDNWTLP